MKYVCKFFTACMDYMSPMYWLYIYVYICLYVLCSCDGYLENGRLFAIAPDLKFTFLRKMFSSCRIASTPKCTSGDQDFELQEKCTLYFV